MILFNKRIILIHLIESSTFWRWSKIVVQEDPELTSSHKHTKTNAYKGMIEHLLQKQMLEDLMEMGWREEDMVSTETPSLMQQPIIGRDIIEGPACRLSHPETW